MGEFDNPATGWYVLNSIEIIPVAFHGVKNQGLIVGTVWNLNTLQRVGDYVSEAKWD